MDMLQNTRSCYHALGTPVAQDRELFSRAKYARLPIKPADLLFVSYTEDFKCLIGTLGGVDRRLNAFIAPAAELLRPVISWRRLAVPADSVLGLAVVNDRLYLLSTRHALKGRIMATDARHPNLRTAAVLLPAETRKIQSMSAGREYLFVTLSDGLRTTAKQLNLRTNRWEVLPLPLVGTADVQPLEPTSNDCLLYLSSWTQPATIYSYSPTTRQARISAGGILIGRAITERPDLFAAAISNVGLSNMLRFENTPNGPNNAKEFGTVKDSAERRALLEMDAMQHVQPGTKYPAVISVGGMNDPRVIAWQPGKLAAALQNASTSGKPVLLQVNYDNGHFTEDKKVAFRNFANMYAFALWQAGHPDFQPNAK